MRKLLVAFIYSVFSISLFAQHSNIDSLKRLLSLDNKDSNRVKHFANLAGNYYYNHPDSEYYYAYQGMPLAQDLHYPKGEILTLYYLGIGLAKMGDFSKSLEALLRRLKMSENSI